MVLLIGHEHESGQLSNAYFPLSYSYFQLQKYDTL